MPQPDGLRRGGVGSGIFQQDGLRGVKVLPTQASSTGVVGVGSVWGQGRAHLPTGVLTQTDPAPKPQRHTLNCSLHTSAGSGLGLCSLVRVGGQGGEGRMGVAG